LWGTIKVERLCDLLASLMARDASVPDIVTGEEHGMFSLRE
jgi:hypothetical protein